MPRIRQKNKAKTEHGEVTNAQYEREAARRNAALDVMTSRRLVRGSRVSARAESARRDGVQGDRTAVSNYRAFGVGAPRERR